MRIKLLLICLVFGFFINAASLAQEPVDTLKLALQLKEQGDYSRVFELLEDYRSKHPNILDVEWMYGEAAYFTKHKRAMIQCYEANIEKNPNNKYLKLDYANKLIVFAEHEKAKVILLGEEGEFLTSAEPCAALSKIYFHQYDYKVALDYINMAIGLDPENSYYKELKHSILRKKAVWLSADYMIFDDNQPLSFHVPAYETGKFVNRYFSPSLNGRIKHLDIDNKRYLFGSLSFSNTFHPVKPQLELNTQLGMYKHLSFNPKLIGKVRIAKKVAKNLVLSSHINRTSYNVLKNSIDTLIMKNDFYLGIYRNNPECVMGQLAFSKSFFDDGNQISNLSFWSVSPPIQLSKIGLRAGYGFAYENAKNDNFFTTRSNKELQMDIYNNQFIEGSFFPYITVKNQISHSIIIDLSYTPFEMLSVSITGNYGFKASVDKPYLYGYYLNNKLKVERGYYQESFNPWELKAKVKAKFSPLFSCELKYVHHTPNFFYASDAYTVALKRIFSSENLTRK